MKDSVWSTEVKVHGNCRKWVGYTKARSGLGTPRKEVGWVHQGRKWVGYSKAGSGLGTPKQKFLTAAIGDFLVAAFIMATRDCRRENRGHVLVKLISRKV